MMTDLVCILVQKCKFRNAHRCKACPFGSGLRKFTLDPVVVIFFKKCQIVDPDKRCKIQKRSYCFKDCKLHIKNNILQRNPSLVSKQNYFLNFSHLNSSKVKRQRNIYGHSIKFL